MDYEFYMGLALEEAKKALEEGEVPVGAIVVKDGEVIASAHNTRERDLDITGHAELAAMKIAAKKLGRWSMEGCSLFVTLEPCIMCSGAISQARVSSVYYGADDVELGGVSSRYSLFQQPSSGKSPLIYRGVRKEECEAILSSFFSCKRK